MRAEELRRRTVEVPTRSRDRGAGDLRPIAERFYYHPSRQGSWSIKEVLPAITGRGYEELEGIQDGGMAMEAYVEAIGPSTSAGRKAEIERELKAYCALDTEGMILVWSFFSQKLRPRKTQGIFRTAVNPFPGGCGKNVVFFTLRQIPWVFRARRAPLVKNHHAAVRVVTMTAVPEQCSITFEVLRVLGWVISSSSETPAGAERCC
jgi:hypothetical protein